jgi:hypothetical protein
MQEKGETMLLTELPEAKVLPRIKPKLLLSKFDRKGLPDVVRWTRNGKWSANGKELINPKTGLTIYHEREAVINRMGKV